MYCNGAEIPNIKRNVFFNSVMIDWSLLKQNGGAVLQNARFKLINTFIPQN